MERGYTLRLMGPLGLMEALILKTKMVTSLDRSRSNMYVSVSVSVVSRKEEGNKMEKRERREGKEGKGRYIPSLNPQESSSELIKLSGNSIEPTSFPLSPTK